MSEKLENDFAASIRILAANIRLFHSGEREAYRVVATELRKLLCDGKHTLLTRLFEDVRLHKLYWTGILERAPQLAEGLSILLPGELRVERSGQVSFRLKFDKSMEQMTLDAWLNQPFLGPDITVRELIRSVSDKEGAHADPKYNEVLVRAKAVKYVADESHKHCIIGIGEYLLAFVGREPLTRRKGAR